MSYEGVIFDFDGVLLNSGYDGFEWAAEVRKQKSNEMGCNYTDRQGFIFGSGSLEEMKRMVEHSSMTWHEFVESERAVAEKKLEMVKRGDMELFPSARDVLEDIQVPKAVVSNAYGDILDRIIKHLSLDDYLEFWTAPRLEEIERYHSIAKPETDMLDRAMRNLGTRNVIMIGDTELDIRAANNAGIESILVNSYGNPVDVEPTYRVEDLEQILRIINSQR